MTCTTRRCAQIALGFTQLPHSAAQCHDLACGRAVHTALSMVRFCALRAQKRTAIEDEIPLRTITSGSPCNSLQMRTCACIFRTIVLYCQCDDTNTYTR